MASRTSCEPNHAHDREPFDLVTTQRAHDQAEDRGEQPGADGNRHTHEMTIVTTVHQLQVVDEPLPHDEHGFTVDYTVTPQEAISCGPAYRPAGLVWPHLGEEQIAAIPVLAAVAK